MPNRTGLWLIGAHGGVSTTVAVGLACLKSGKIDQCGLVSELEQFSRLGLANWSDIVLGGHDIRNTDANAEAMKLAASSRAFDISLVEAAATELGEFNERIRPGIILNVGTTINSLADEGRFSSAENAASAMAIVKEHLSEFKESNDLDRVVVINVSSTEPPYDASKLPSLWSELEPLMQAPECDLPASSIYAAAALDLGMPFVNFTPSAGNCLDALDDLANQRDTCHMGHDGKTGETFMKSVLAPAFAKRNLNVMSWVGHNIFGNMDGLVLDDPVNKETKVTSKDKLLGQILGYDPQSHVSIEYIKSLGDWKTAWDHIHFRGFLGTQMTLQFTWQGCDSVLAAPLVLDLFRFTELAARKGETGLLVWLSSFFKSPLGTDENDFSAQFVDLESWVELNSEVHSEDAS
ncbi:MAG: inositol-3-phosphate synthase [Planctomycetota bacterium]